MRGKSDTNWPMLAVLGVIVLILAGVISIGPAPQPGTIVTPPSPDGGTTIVQTGVGYATTVSAGGQNAITGAAVDVNSNLFANDGSWAGPETQTNSQPESLSTSAPNSLSGYLIIGNDENQGTDRGTEVYYRKIPFSYVNVGSFVIKDTDGNQWIQLYDEGTPTFTGYDDGSAESTLNISVASGATVTSTEMKIEASSDACIGNPDFDNPIAVCFNASTNSDWDEIRPSSYVSSFDAPDFLSGYNILGNCYVLPTPALCDYSAYRFYIVLDAASGKDPNPNDQANLFLLDKTWFKNDQNQWVSGWGDDSDQGTDYDPGMAAIGNEKTISFS